MNVRFWHKADVQIFSVEEVAVVKIVSLQRLNRSSVTGFGSY